MLIQPQPFMDIRHTSSQNHLEGVLPGFFAGLGRVVEETAFVLPSSTRTTAAFASNSN